MDDETLKDFSFTKGKVLITTEEQSRIERWIRLDVGGLRYDVLVKEESSCANPDKLGMEFRWGVIEKIENLQQEGGMGLSMVRREVEDDDVESCCHDRRDAGEEVRVSRVAKLMEGQRKKTGLDEVQGSKQRDSDLHLMQSSGGLLNVEGEFESFVEDSVNLRAQDGLEERDPIGLLQSPPVGLPVGLGKQSNSGPDLAEDEMALPLTQAQKFPSMPNPKLRASVSENLEDSFVGSTQQKNGAPQTSLLSGINLTVDLNNVDCRRRRHRQLSNLIQIHEEISGELEEEEAESNSSTESIESSQHIIDEVRATMAIGAELNVNFLPDDDRVLKKMILLETKEAASLRDKEGGK